MGHRKDGLVNAEYRAVAARICATVSATSLSSDCDLRVNPHGLVQPVSDGAFVECVLFVHASTLAPVVAATRDGGAADAA